MTNTLLKTQFFSLAFFNHFWEGLGGVWGGFWKGFGVFLASIGSLLASFLGACILNALQKESWRLLGWIFTPFGRVGEGSGKDFGRFGEEFGQSKIVVFLDCETCKLLTNFCTILPNLNDRLNLCKSHLLFKVRRNARSD